MKLSSFVQETIFEIALGIQAAKVRAKDLVAVSPGNLGGTSVIEKSYVDFEVSIAVKESESASRGGKAGLSGRIQVAQIASVGLSAGGEADSSSASESERLHRITFRVPVYFNAHMRGDPTMSAEAELIERIIRDNEQP